MRVRNPDIIMVWPRGRELSRPPAVDGYWVQPLSPEQDDWWIDIHRSAVPSFREADLVAWLARYRSLALPDGILVATDAAGEPVATAGSIANSKQGMFPDGGQLAWVATVPEHRGRGLGEWLSALATARLLDDGFRKIFLVTGDDLTDAIRVYLRLGYIPYLYARDQRDRWARICAINKTPYTPDDWLPRMSPRAGE